MIFKRLISFKHFVIVATVLSSSSVYAKSVGDSMGDFWNSVGGTYSNTSEAGSYQLQGAGYYTGGSFVARTKVVSVNPITITPPGIRAGCGGIDVYTGAFSHINTDQFVALLKAIPSNAMGFAFQLALETMSPSIKGTMDQLQSVIDKINSTNLNSCDLAQNTVAYGLKYSGLSQKYCEVSANSKGYATDFARAKNECGTGGKSSQHINDADNANGDNRMYNINIAWEVLKKSSILSDGSDELAQFIQALTGSIIIKSPENENSGPQIAYKSNILVKDETIKAILDGGSVTILSCDEKDKCLNPTEKTINIPAEKGFKKRISDAMGEMTSRLATGEKFDNKHIDLVTKTSLPIHKAMIVRQAYFGSSTAASGLNPEYYSSLVAIDMLYYYLDEILKSVHEQSKNIKNFDQENVERFQKGIEAARKELANYRIDSKDNFEQGLKLVEATQRIQPLVAAKMSNRMKQNLIWASKF